MDLTQTYIKECLDYNPETGTFFWRVRPLSHFKDLRRQRIFNRMYAGKACGNLSEEQYLIIGISGVVYKAHRLAWLYVHGYMPTEWLDHINRNRSDNRICNLRIASPALNAQNASIRKDNKSGVQGVSWHKATKKWVVQISKQGKTTHVGLFESIKDAVAAREQAELVRAGSV
jgi:hypothetical protein